MTTKTCTKCGQTKPITEFSNDRSRQSGRSNQCRECDRAHQVYLRSLPGYSCLHSTKRLAKKNNIPFDPVLFSGYDAFWSMIQDKWEAAQKRNPDHVLTIRRIDETRGYYMTNIRIVPSRRNAPVAVTQPNDDAKNTPQDISQEFAHMEKHDRDLYDVVLKALGDELGISPDQVRGRIDRGWTTRLLQLVRDNQELAAEIDKTLSKK